MLRIIMMIFSLIAVVTSQCSCKYSAYLTEKQPAEITNRLPVLFTPAGYVFSIWASYLYTSRFWLYGFMRNKGTLVNALLNRRVFLFMFSCLFNIAWILLWHYEFFNWTIVIMLGTSCKLLTIYFTYPKKENRFYERVPIAVYLGWIFVATIANVSYVLTLHEWNGWGLSDPLWTVIYLTIATAIALHFLYHYADIAFNLVFIWAFIGIAVKNGFDELFVSAAALFLDRFNWQLSFS